MGVVGERRVLDVVSGDVDDDDAEQSLSAVQHLVQSVFEEKRLLEKPRIRLYFFPHFRSRSLNQPDGTFDHRRSKSGQRVEVQSSVQDKHEEKKVRTGFGLDHLVHYLLLGLLIVLMTWFPAWLFACWMEPLIIGDRNLNVGS